MSPAAAKVSAISFELPFGSASQASTEAELSMRMPPVGRMPISRIWRPISLALRTMVRNCLRSASEPIAEPPPAPAQIGATKEPTARPWDAMWSDMRLTASRSLSMSKCGATTKRSTPSNFAPSASALAVRVSSVSSGMIGSESGAPFPTMPGHMALCSFG